MLRLRKVPLSCYSKGMRQKVRLSAAVVAAEQDIAAMSREIADLEIA